MMFRKKRAARQRRPAPSDKKSQPVFSYYGQRGSGEATSVKKPSNPFHKKPNQDRPWWHYAPSIIATVAIIMSLVYVLSLSSDPKILSAGGNSDILIQPTAVYQQAAQQQFKSSWLNHSKLTVNTASIASGLKAEFPELADVSVALPLIGRRPVVYIIPSPPVLLLKSQNNSFIIDQQGKAMATLSPTTSVLAGELPTVIDQSGLKVKAGQEALPSNYVSFITTTIEQLGAKQLKIAHMVLPPSSFELDIQLSGQSYIIKMNLQEDATEQIGAYLAAAPKLSQSNQTPSNYFDVRVPGRVYYK